MKNALLATAFGFATLTAAPVLAEPVEYTLDSSHSQIIFSYNHLGFSTTYGMFSGFEGEIMFDQENPANSSVSVAMPVTMMFTGWEKRDEHFMSEDFFNVSADAAEPEMVTFTSTSIDVTGEDTAKIHGDLTLNDITKSITLDARLNQTGPHPMQNTDWAGFDATTTLLRSDFGVDRAAPFVGDEVNVVISIEAQRADTDS